MSRSRKTFIAQVSLPPDSATSLLTMMAASALKWGFESDGATPSLDSVIGSDAGLIPDSTVFLGVDSNVRAATSGSFYRGVTVVAGQNFSLQDFGGMYGVIDPSAIYCYNQSGCDIDLTFKAR